MNGPVNGSDLAFPVADSSNCQYPGLTKREYFAAKALQGLLANGADLREQGFRDRCFAEFARMQADWLIEELSK